MDKYNLQMIVQNTHMYSLPQTGKNIYYYLTKHLKPCWYTPVQIKVGLVTRKISNIVFILVVYSCGINYTYKYNLLHIK